MVCSGRRTRSWIKKCRSNNRSEHPERWNSRKVLNCGNGAHSVAAFGLKPALSEDSEPIEKADTKSGKSLRSDRIPRRWREDLSIRFQRLNRSVELLPSLQLHTPLKSSIVLQICWQAPFNLETAVERGQRRREGAKKNRLNGKRF